MLFPTTAPALLPSATAYSRPPAAQARLAGGRFSVWLAHGIDAADATDAQLPPPVFAPFLFSTIAHARTQPGADGLIWTALIDNLSGDRVGQWLLWTSQTEPHLVRSPGQAPFAGPQVVETVPLMVISEWLTVVLKAVNALGYHHLYVRLPPDIYAPTALTRIVTALCAAGMSVSRKLSNISHFLPIGQADGFVSELTSAAVRRLRKLQLNGFTTEQEPPEALPEVLEAISRWRYQRGHSLSMPQEALTALVQSFPNQFLILSVRTPSGARAATVIAVWITPQTLYYFMPASHPDFDNASPALLLLSGLYEIGSAAGGTFLDLGPSLSSMGEFNPSLARFKQSVGGVAAMRLVLRGPTGKQFHHAADALMDRLAGLVPPPV